MRKTSRKQQCTLERYKTKGLILSRNQDSPVQINEFCAPCFEDKGFVLSASYSLTIQSCLKHHRWLINMGRIKNYEF